MPFRRFCSKVHHNMGQAPKRGGSPVRRGAIDRIEISRGNPRTPSLDDAAAQIPAARVPAARVPAAQIPAARVPAARVPAAQIPAGGSPEASDPFPAVIRAQSLPIMQSLSLARPARTGYPNWPGRLLRTSVRSGRERQRWPLKSTRLGLRDRRISAATRA